MTKIDFNPSMQRQVTKNAKLEKGVYEKEYSVNSLNGCDGVYYDSSAKHILEVMEGQGHLIILLNEQQIKHKSLKKGSKVEILPKTNFFYCGKMILKETTIGQEKLKRRFPIYYDSNGKVLEDPKLDVKKELLLEIASSFPYREEDVIFQNLMSSKFEIIQNFALSNSFEKITFDDSPNISLLMNYKRVSIPISERTRAYRILGGHGYFYVNGKEIEVASGSFQCVLPNRSFAMEGKMLIKETTGVAKEVDTGYKRVLGKKDN